MTSTATDVIDGVSGSTAIKAPVRCKTTANITLSGFQAIDGVTLAAGDENLRVLVDNQTDATENGIYDAGASAWTRAADFDGNRDVKTGTLVPVNSGTLYAGTLWRCTTADPIVIDTSSISFSQYVGTFSSATTAAAGAVELDTDAEAITATDTSRAMTAANVRAAEPTNLAYAVANATAKTTPGAADIIGILDSAASNVLKRSTIQQIITGLSLFSSINIQVFTATGADTYTPTSGMKYCIVITTGAGGGGGGADTDGNSGIIGVGGGGGAGGTCIEFFTAAQIGASQTVTIGAGGAAGSATNGTSGGNGGDTTFGALHTGVGGTGGTGSGASTSAHPELAGGAGGTPTGGTLNIIGGHGGYGVGVSVDGTTDAVIAISGSGGASFWGGGGGQVAAAQTSLTTDVDTAGIAGQGFGSGGSGALSLTSTTGAAGGAGKDGVCIVIEFI
jgi:hypothetical protein